MLYSLFRPFFLVIIIFIFFIYNNTIIKVVNLTVFNLIFIHILFIYILQHTHKNNTNSFGYFVLYIGSVLNPRHFAVKNNTQIPRYLCLLCSFRENSSYLWDTQYLIVLSLLCKRLYTMFCQYLDIMHG